MYEPKDTPLPRHHVTPNQGRNQKKMIRIIEDMLLDKVKKFWKDQIYYSVQSGPELLAPLIKTCGKYFALTMIQLNRPKLHIFLIMHLFKQKRFHNYWHLCFLYLVQPPLARITALSLFL